MGNACTCFEREHWDSHHHVNNPYNPSKPPQDMTRPLSHYFISSGHNSYLSGNQLTSGASTRTIEFGLKQGCRVIELDVYDGPQKQPICTHGGTLTSNVSFHDCVKAIGRYAFAASPYPVILTIENHAGQEQQGVMADHMHKVLGEHLFVPSPNQLAADGCWLSPEALKHKVLVRMKVKPESTNPELARIIYIRNSSISSYNVEAGPTAPSSHSLPETKLPAVPEYEPYAEFMETHLHGSTSTFRSTLTGLKGRLSSVSSRKPSSSKSIKKPGTAAAAAAAAAAAVAAGGGSGVMDGEGGGPTNEELLAAAASAKVGGGVLGEKAAAAAAAEVKLVEEQDDTAAASDQTEPATASYGLAKPALPNVLAYAKQHLLRVYPGAIRMVDNSNPHPSPAWCIGASLAALNWQLWDDPMWVNEAFFSTHGHCGYVLKPDWMTQGTSSSGLPNRLPRQLVVTVYSAYKFQGNKMGLYKDDPYVELKVFGMPCDCAAFRSNHVYDSGRLVVDQTFKMPIAFPEMGVLLVLLKDKDKGTLDPVHGYASLPLATLAEGEYQLRLTKPFEMGAKPEPLGMWVKLKLGWEEQGSCSSAAGAPGAAAASTAGMSAATAAAADATASVFSGEATSTGAASAPGRDKAVHV